MRKIIFASKVQGVADLHPVVYAKDIKWRWAELMREDYKTVAEQLKYKSYTHTFRCPGIFDLTSTGFILPMPWDITIETNGDGKTFFADTPGSTLEKYLETPLVDAHLPDSIAKHVPLGPDCLKTVVKLHSPWQIIVPEGIKFLMIPVPYPEQHIFENFIGILDSSISSEIHFQLKWKKLLGRHMIKAGTPMAQLIPLTDERFELVCRDFNAEDQLWFDKKKYFHTHNITRDHKVIKKMYEKYYYHNNKITSRIKQFVKKIFKK